MLNVSLPPEWRQESSLALAFVNATDRYKFTFSRNRALARVSALTGIGKPGDLAFDNSGNLFVSDFTAQKISKVTPAGVVTPFVTGIGQAFGLAFDSNGILFEADNGTGKINKITPDGIVTPFVQTDSTSLRGLAFDASGNLFQASSGSGKINKITPSGVITTFATGVGGSGGLAFAPNSTAPTSVPEAFTIIGTLVGGTAAIRMRKKLNGSIS